MTRISIETGDERHTRAVGEALAERLEPGDVVALSGELGAGKTVFVQGMARGLKIDSGVLVTSPSFVILHEYPGPVPLYHFDFYRLESVEEVVSLGYEEYFEGEGICAVEWADKFPSLFGPGAYWVALSGAGGPTRTVEIDRREDVTADDGPLSEAVERILTEQREED